MTQMTLPVLHSTLSPHALRDVISATYDTRPLTGCRLLKRGWNDTYEVETPDRRYVLRVYRASRTLSDVLYELRLIEHVNERGVRAAAPIRARDGSLTVCLDAPEGERCATLFAYADGASADFDDPDEMYRFGATTAAFHDAADSFSDEHERTTLSMEELLRMPARAVRPHLRDRPQDDAYLVQLTTRLRRQLDELTIPTADAGPCHGDLHTGNIHSNDGSLTLLDFDFCGRSFRAYDLAAFAGIVTMKHARPSWDAFLNGYNDRRPLNSEDLALIPLFTVVRYIWLVGIRLARSPEAGEAWIDGYLDTWFGVLRRAAGVLDAVPDEVVSLDDVIGMVDRKRRPRQFLRRLMHR